MEKSFAFLLTFLGAFNLYAPPIKTTTLSAAKKPTTSKKKYPCTQCTASYNQVGTLNHHIETKHNGEIFSCPVGSCTHKPFGTKSGLFRHNRSVHEKVTFACSRCDQLFTTPNGRDIHEKKSCAKRTETTDSPEGDVIQNLKFEGENDLFDPTGLELTENDITTLTAALLFAPTQQ